MQAPSSGAWSRERSWQPDFSLDLATVLAPLVRGSGDPVCRLDRSGVAWLAANTADGPGALALRRLGTQVMATAWGQGAMMLLDGMPALLGANDDDTGFRAHHPIVAELRRRMPTLRLGATGRVWDVLVAAVLEQKVAGIEARKSWRELCRRFGTPAPGPTPAGMFAPPTPRAVLAIPDWEWHKAGVDGARRRTLIAAAQVADRLERAVELGGEQGRGLLRAVPGIGLWTAAEVAQRAWADADAVSVGDFHVPSVVGQKLLGRPLDDNGMLEVLAPYAPHRHRVIRYLEADRTSRSRFAQRSSRRDYRAL